MWTTAWAHPGEMLSSYILYSGRLCLLVPCTLELCWGNFKLVNFTGSFCWENWFSVPRLWYLLCSRGVAAFGRCVEMWDTQEEEYWGICDLSCWESAVGAGGKGMQLSVCLATCLLELRRYFYAIFKCIFYALCPDLLCCFGFFLDVLCISTKTFNDLRLCLSW